MSHTRQNSGESSEFNLLHAGIGMVVLSAVFVSMEGCSKSPPPQARNVRRPTYSAPVSNAYPANTYSRNTYPVNRQYYAPGPNAASLQYELSNLAVSIRALEQYNSQHRSQISWIDRELAKPLSDAMPGVDMWTKSTMASRKAEYQNMINRNESEIRSLQRRIRDISITLARR